MRSKRIPAEEQYRLIMECRQSGLTDHQWCVEHNIKPGTFYNWVKRLRQKGCVDLPASTVQIPLHRITDSASNGILFRFVGSRILIKCYSFFVVIIFRLRKELLV